MLRHQHQARRSQRFKHVAPQESGSGFPGSCGVGVCALKVSFLPLRESDGGQQSRQINSQDVWISRLWRNCSYQGEPLGKWASRGPMEHRRGLKPELRSKSGICTLDHHGGSDKPGHSWSLELRARSRLNAALIRATWVNACGKFPKPSAHAPVSSA